MTLQDLDALITTWLSAVTTTKAKDADLAFWGHDMHLGILPHLRAAGVEMELAGQVRAAVGRLRIGDAWYRVGGCEVRVRGGVIWTRAARD